MDRSKVHGQAFLKRFSLMLAIISALLFISQPTFSAYLKKSKESTQCQYGKLAQDCQQDSPTGKPEAPVLKAGFSALVPVGSFSPAQIPEIYPSFIQLCEFSAGPIYQSLQGCTPFFKTLFNRIISPNAP